MVMVLSTQEAAVTVPVVFWVIPTEPIAKGAVIETALPFEVAPIPAEERTESLLMAFATEFARIGKVVSLAWTVY